jgi:Flp pilus assembly protein TadG
MFGVNMPSVVDLSRLMNKRHRSANLSKGLATVEAAMCLPIITLLMLSTIDACTMIFLKQSLTIAAYEGGRTALIPGATASNIESDCLQLVADRSINDAQIVLQPSKPEIAKAGSRISVTVSAPCGANSVIPSLFFQGRTLSATAHMMKEYD